MQDLFFQTSFVHAGVDLTLANLTDQEVESIVSQTDRLLLELCDEEGYDETCWEDGQLIELNRDETFAHCVVKYTLKRSCKGGAA